MALFDNNSEQQSKSSRRGPTESIGIADGLQAALWEAQSEDGQVRYNWDISRLSEDGSRSYKTKTVTCLLNYPVAIARLCEAFSQCASVPAELREKLAHQAEVLFECCLKLSDARGERKANGRAHANSVFAA